MVAFCRAVGFGRNAIKYPGFRAMTREGDFMFPCLKRTTTGFRADYAAPADFCEILQRDMEPLYRLTLLLTADSKAAEKCFTSTVEEAFKEKSVFKDWAQPWVKRCLIKNAIRIVSPVAAGGAGNRASRSAQAATLRDAEVAVMQLPPLERFVFIVSVLERYSIWDCSLLLGCSMKKVAEARQRALSVLPELGPHAAEAHPSGRLEVPAYAGAIVSAEILQQTSFERSAS
jgi:DNA-directed RNA polymerase specialized sigma24 family protein